jgi:hypothetical protein
MANTQTGATSPVKAQDQIAILADALKFYTDEAISAIARLNTLTALIAQIPAGELHYINALHAVPRHALLPHGSHAI